jgi:DNA-directed RNA polymerase specialized sigma24 family protein
MTPSSEEALFALALAKPAAERAVWLDRECGGGAEQISVDDQLLAVNDALDKFAALDPRKAELVKLRYFVRTSFEEAAAALGIAVPTAKQWWAYACAWLRVDIADSKRGKSPAEQ